jgi:hypothetical protein
MKWNSKISAKQLLTLFIINCFVLSQLTHFYYEIPPSYKDEIDSYVALFEQVCNTKVTVKQYFGKLPSHQFAICFGMELPKHMRGIVYNHNWYQTAGRLQKEMTVLHELGHCESGLYHDERFSFSGPVSLMFPHDFGDFIYLSKIIQYRFSVCRSDNF